MEAREAPSRVRDLPTWLLARAAQRGQRLVAARTAELGATRTVYSALAALHEFGVLSQADVGRRIGLEPDELAALAATLEADGLVERSADPDDAHHPGLRITPRGIRMLERLDDAISLAQDDLLAALSVSDRVELARLLAAISEPGAAS